MKSVVSVYLSLLISGLAGSVVAQTTNSGVYTLQQAHSGQSVYLRECSACHGVDLRGGEGGTALLGSAFLDKWSSHPLSSLYGKSSLTMPLANPNSLTAAEYHQLLAYILLVNGYQPGDQELAGGLTGLTGVRMGVPEGDAKTLLTQLNTIVATPSASAIEWPYVRGDAGSSNYSPLDIINANNVADLDISWRWKTDNFGATPEYNFQATPIMVGGILYTTAGKRRVPVAIDARNGETLWMYRIDEGKRGENAPRSGSGRGLSYAEVSGRSAIYYITPGYQLIGLDASNGTPLKGFGDHGIVDLKTQLDQDIDVATYPIGASSSPIVVNGVVVVGSAFLGGAAPASPEAVKGHIMGFDAQTGERKWIFHTVPKPGEEGSDTWLNGSWKYSGNTGAWAQLSADPEHDLVFVPVEAATGDFYGGHRPGDNLYSQSLVALDASSGTKVWHFQMVHHDLWDYDPPAPPVLFDSVQNSVRIPAIAQVSKQGFVYAFNRLTGEPLWPIDERSVPQSSVPGEQTSATQPIPSKPAPFAPQGVGLEQLNDLTPEIYEEAKRIAAQYTTGPLYTPPSVETATSKGTLILPSAFGGANWPGGVMDLETSILYVGASHQAMALKLAKSDQSTMDWVLSRSRITGPFGLPLMKPPYGTITAIDMNTGEHVWRMANGETPDEIQSHPKLQGLDVAATGKAERVGLLVTKSLLFAGEGSGLYVSNGGGRMFRAHNKLTGEVVWEYELPANQSGLPMSYALDGEQYIVVPIGAKGHPGELVALKLR